MAHTHAFTCSQTHILSHIEVKRITWRPWNITCSYFSLPCCQWKWQVNMHSSSFQHYIVTQPDTTTIVTSTIQATISSFSNLINNSNYIPRICTNLYKTIVLWNIQVNSQLLLDILHTIKLCMQALGWSLQGWWITFNDGDHSLRNLGSSFHHLHHSFNCF